ncbi:small integral membrane protein 24 [Emydura macquarii macquarii]|uniref:small integral membrane protein 24 n=1 Tax=Emydura macquarii macquarii TaxID=1129001 RepID=UPI00352B1045
MSRLRAVLLSLIFIASSQAQGAVQGTTSGSQMLQPWLVGLTAVVVFLFIVFVLMIINRVWCYKKRRDEEEPLGELATSRSVANTYDNLTLDEDKEEAKEKAEVMKETQPNKTTSL